MNVGIITLMKLPAANWAGSPLRYDKLKGIAAKANKIQEKYFRNLNQAFKYIQKEEIIFEL